MGLPQDGRNFRRVLGHHPTGVCVVTWMEEAGPVGMVVGSFTSVSLDPPLVAFLPDRKSTSWPRLEATGRFCVNVLSDRQRALCTAMSSPAATRFDGWTYRRSPGGLPILDGVVAWIDCELSAVHEAGDHFIAIGRVHALDVESARPPLLFFQGGYGGFSSLPMDDPQSAPSAVNGATTLPQQSGDPR